MLAYRRKVYISSHTIDNKLKKNSQKEISFKEIQKAINNPPAGVDIFKEDVS